MKNQRYFYEYCGQMKECHNLESYGYFLAGYQDEKMKGLLYTLSLSDNGTVLTPVFNENKEMICRPEHAGKEYNEVVR